MSAWHVLAKHFDDTAGLYAPEAHTIAILSALRAAGYAVVPITPTHPMRAAGGKHMHGGDATYCQYSAARAWAAMLAAAEGDKL